MKKPRTKHSKEFKEQAVAMMKTRTHAKVARQLGINSSLLYKWRDQLDTHGENAFPGHGVRPPLSERSSSRPTTSASRPRTTF